MINLVNNFTKFSLFTGIVLITLLNSCASYKYRGTKERKRNNYVTITSENLKDFTISNSFDGKKIEQVSNGTKEVSIDKLKSKNLSLTFTNPIYDPIQVELKRTVRPIALSKDIALGIFTFAIPIIVDVFNPDFYMLKKSSRKLNVHFEYKQSYMKEEFDKISNSKNPSDFQNWITNYPKSNIKQQVVDHKDSLELSIALSKETESAVDDYISTHQQSSFLNEAQTIKNEMVAARQLFESTKTTNTVASYESFLAKYPRSLHNSDAHKKLIIAAEKAAISLGTTISMRDYVNKYLDVQKSYLSSKELDEKKTTISKAIDGQIVKDNIKKDSKKVYQEYSNLWKAFNQLKNEVPQDYLQSMESTLSFQPKICDLLFTQLKEANTGDKQKVLADKISNDFPQLELYEKDKNIFITILENSSNSSGNVKLFNVGYMPYYFNNMSERDALIGRSFYQYKNSEYQALQNITNEDLNFSNGQLSGLIKCFKNSDLDFSLSITNGNPKEISYCQNGKLVKTLYFLPNYKTYEYEFENGVNLTLKVLDSKIEEGNNYLKAGNYDKAISTFEGALSNNIPTTVNQNVNLQKNLSNAKTQKTAYLQKLEQERIAEEKKRKIEEEKLKAEYSKSICISGKFVCENSLADGVDWSESPELYNLTYHKLASKYAVTKFNANGTAESGSGDNYGRGVDFDMYGFYTIVGNTITIDWQDKYVGDDVLTIIGSQIDLSQKCMKTTKFRTKEWVNGKGKRSGGEIFENIEY
jgi:hypothetical protein